MNNMNKIFIISVILILTALHAGLRNPTAMGPSYSNSLLLKGIDVVRYNPANLGLSDNYKGSINFFPVSVFMENSFPKSVYDDYIAYSGDSVNVISVSDRKDILDQLNDKWRIQNNVNIDVIGFSTENSAFTLNINSISDITFPEKLLDLMLNGNDMGVEYSIDDFNAEVMNTVSLGYSFAKPISLDGVKEIVKELSVGATIRYIYAVPTVEMEDLDNNNDGDIKVAYFKMKNAEVYLDTDEIPENDEGATTIRGSFDLLTSEGGQGIGLDFGIAAKLNGRMSMGLSVINALAGISWYKNNKIYSYDFVVDGLILSELEDAQAEIDSMYTIKDVAETRKFVTVLPPEINLDFTWEFRPGKQRLYWTNSYRQGFKNELLSSTMPIFSTGIQWNHMKSDWFVFRAGISGGGESLFSSAAGFSLAFSHYSFDLAVESKYGYGASSKGIGVAVGQKFYW